MCRTSSSVRLWWAFKEPKGSKKDLKDLKGLKDLKDLKSLTGMNTGRVRWDGVERKGEVKRGGAKGRAG